MARVLKLNNGAVMPLIGLGVNAKNDRTADGIHTAIEIGYRGFDTAREYGTEPLLGSALAKAFEARAVRREDVFVTTKLSPVDTAPADVVTALRSSLKDLQLEYVDLFLVHWPLRAKRTADFFHLQPGDLAAVDQKGLWQAMESCVDAGLAKSIGVSNWSIKKLDELLPLARIPPAVNQVEMHAMWRQDKLRKYCRQKGILITAYSPLGAPNSKYGTNDVITNPILNDIAQREKKTPAQVALRWLTDKGVGFVVRSYNRTRLEENFDVMDSPLAAADLERVDSIPERRILAGVEFVQPDHGPIKSLQELWDE